MADFNWLNNSMFGGGPVVAPFDATAGPTGAAAGMVGPSATAGMAPVAERFDFLNDPNMQQMLASMGQGFSTGQPVGQVLGTAAQDLARKRALQSAMAAQSQRRGSLIGDIREAIRRDPTGKTILGPKEDMGTVNDYRVDNDKITVTLPNEDRTVPYAPESLQDISPENLTVQGSDLRDFQ